MPNDARTDLIDSMAAKDYEALKDMSLFKQLLVSGRDIDAMMAREAQLDEEKIRRFNAALQYARKQKGAQSLGDALQSGMMQKGFNTARRNERGDDVVEVIGD